MSSKGGFANLLALYQGWITAPWYFTFPGYHHPHCAVILKGKHPRNCLQVQMGIAQMGRGVSTFARMVWGTYLEKFKWAICLIVGGSKCLPVWFGALMQWKLKFKLVIAWLWRSPKCLPGWFGALITINTMIWQSCSIRSENKVPQSARLTEGGNVQINLETISGGLP